MSVHPTTQHPSYAPARIPFARLVRGLAIAGTALTASLAFTGVAAATTSPSTSTVMGNPNCASLGGGLREVKVDPVPQGVTSFRDGTFDGSITVSGRFFDWRTDEGVDAVIVKGGPNATVYRFGTRALDGRGFSAPLNPSNGQRYGLSHISFCRGAGATTQPPTPQQPPQQPTDDVPRVNGNPTCADVGGAGLRELKVEPVSQGRTTFGDGTIRGTIVVSGVYFDWSSDQGVDIVIVKGGDNASVYRADEARSGTALRAPINPSNGQPYGLSHITYCYDTEQAPPASCPTGTTPMPDGTCKTDEQPGPAPCTPGGAAVMPNGEPCVKDEKPATETSSEPPVTQTTVDPTPSVSAQSAPTPAPVAPVTVTVASRTPQGTSQVLGATGMVREANARMQGPKRCVTRPFRQVLNGRGVKRVTITVNGRTVRTFTAARSTYAITIDPRKYRTRVLRVSARVEYVASSGKKAQTLRMTVLRCAAQAGQQVRFAG